jgi:hypothetical protein
LRRKLHSWPCQAVSYRLPTAALVRAWVKSCGICGRQSGIGAGFLRVLRFPLPISIPSIAPNHHRLSSGAGTIGQIVTAVPNGLSLPPMREKNKFFYHSPNVIMEFIMLKCSTLLHCIDLTWRFAFISAYPGSRKLRSTAVGIRCADHATPSIRKSLDKRWSLGWCRWLAD